MAKKDRHLRSNLSRDQESVWDYPRPPKLDYSSEHIVVKLGKHIIADSTHSIRILETASPPTYYLPKDDLNFNFFRKHLEHLYVNGKELLFTGISSPQQIYYQGLDGHILSHLATIKTLLTMFPFTPNN